VTEELRTTTTQLLLMTTTWQLQSASHALDNIDSDAGQRAMTSVAGKYCHEAMDGTQSTVSDMVQRWWCLEQSANTHTTHNLRQTHSSTSHHTISTPTHDELHCIITVDVCNILYTNINY